MPPVAALPAARWRPRLARGAAPLYRAIADALEADIRAGRLAAGDVLPTQRDLAEQLGVNFTTITRAYAEARGRGLISARVGSGTFVAAPARARPPHSPQARPQSRARLPVVAPAEEAGADAESDLSVNAPPTPAWMPDALRDALGQAAADPAVTRAMLTYAMRHGAGREAGVAWLGARGLDATPARVAVAAGAQHALTLLLNTLARAGDTVLVESLCYPGLQGAAATAGVRLAPVAIDAEGVRPDALDDACRRLAPKALFCVPTLQNPTTAVMAGARRRDVVEVARRHGLRIVEDDICGPLLRAASGAGASDAAPLAALAPELVTYVGSLSKCVAPGLRTAFVLAPNGEDAARLDGAVRASVLMLSPLPLAVASSWIHDGTAERAVADVAAEAAARGALARRILGEANVDAPAGSLHAWLRLPPTWTVAAFVAQAHQQRTRVAPADWYVMPGADAPVPNAVRIALGGVPERARLERTLAALATILEQSPALRTSSL